MTERDLKNEMDTIYEKLKNCLPSVWDGKECIMYMKNEGCNQWRQMEWPGFYFQYMCETFLGKDHYFNIPGPTYGNVIFDGFRKIPWDFKAHSIDPSQPNKEQIPTNGYNESCCAIDDYGVVGFIIIMGDTVYDDEKESFKHWHDEMKGKISNYEIERVARGAKSRRRKVQFIPSELVFVFVDNENISSCGKFQQGMRNSDGTPRNAKIMLDLNKNKELKVYRYKF